jgi:hypothetical protein
MIFDDPDRPPDLSELIKRGIVKLQTLPPIKKKPMKKLIPFDIEKARNGAKVVTETGNPVTVVNFNLQVPDFTKKYILGYFTNPDMGDIECYECWPQSGKFEDGVGRPPDLMIEEEVEDKPIISEVEYEEGYDDSDSVVRMSGRDWAKHRAVRDQLKDDLDTLNKEIGSLKSDKDTLIKQFEILQAENRSLNAWKESQLKVWGDVINFVYEYEHSNLKIGDSVAEWVLRRLKEVTHLYDINNKLRDEIRVIKGQAK